MSWSSNVLNCCGDAQCTAVLCCSPITTGQLYERVVQQRLFTRMPGASCLTISILLFILYIGAQAFSGIEQQWAMAVGSVLGLLMSIAMCLIVSAVRQAIRERDGINGSLFEDLCCSCWCNPCVQCQLFRHDRAGCGDGYNLCDSTGAPLPPPPSIVGVATYV